VESRSPGELEIQVLKADGIGALLKDEAEAMASALMWAGRLCLKGDEMSIATADETSVTGYGI
jgi:hypothetical protein